MWNALENNLGNWGIFLAILIIFVAKIVEVTIGTLRQILVVKGYRTLAVLLALIVLPTLFMPELSRQTAEDKRRRRAQRGKFAPRQAA